MPIPKPPYRAEFRRQMVELVQSGRTPAQLAGEFNCSARRLGDSTGLCRVLARRACCNAFPRLSDGARPSMGIVGDAYDNAMAEIFFATLECELIDRRGWPTNTDARLSLFTSIEDWYSLRRRHSALGQTSPANFEREHDDRIGTQPPRGAHGIPTVGACVAGATPPVDIPAPELIEPT